MLIWIVACYVTMTSFAGKEPRYMIYWLPPFVYFAVCPLTVKYRALWIRAVQVAAVSALLVIHMRSGWAYQRPYVSGYAALADYVTHQSQESGIILYDAGLHENFIFFLRTYDPARRFVVMRKALYAVRIVQERGSRELLYNASQLQGLIKRYGIKYIIVSDNSPLAFEVQKTLRELLKTPQFRLVKSFPIETNSPRGENQLLLYENNDVVPRSERWLRLEMLTLSRDIVVSLDNLLGQ